MNITTHTDKKKGKEKEVKELKKKKKTKRKKAKKTFCMDLESSPHLHIPFHRTEMKHTTPSADLQQTTKMKKRKRDEDAGEHAHQRDGQPVIDGVPSVVAINTEPNLGDKEVENNYNNNKKSIKDFVERESKNDGDEEEKGILKKKTKDFETRIAQITDRISQTDEEEAVANLNQQKSSAQEQQHRDDDDDGRGMHQSRADLLAERSALRRKLSDWRSALEDAARALTLDNQHFKVITKNKNTHTKKTKQLFFLLSSPDSVCVLCLCVCERASTRESAHTGEERGEGAERDSMG